MNKAHAPIHPGEILLEEFLVPYGVSQYELAKVVGFIASNKRNSARQARDHPRYSASIGTRVRHQRPILSKSSGKVRSRD